MFSLTTCSHWCFQPTPQALGASLDMEHIRAQVQAVSTKHITHARDKRRVFESVIGDLERVRNQIRHANQVSPTVKAD